MEADENKTALFRTAFDGSICGSAGQKQHRTFGESQRRMPARKTIEAGAGELENEHVIGPGGIVSDGNADAFINGMKF